MALSAASNGRLAGKVILITGAAQGIGKASALKCASERAKVIATDINYEKLQGLKQENSSIETVKLDVTKAGDIEEIFRKHPDVNVLFNCAGYVFQGNIEDTKESDWDFSFDLNVKSIFYTSKACISMWKEQKMAGNIINMSSVASSIKGAPNRFLYGASKAAVLGITKSIAVDYVSDKIRCNAICPGTVETPSLDDRIKALGDYDEVKASFVSRQKMGRLGTADEVASMVVYLASDETSFVTGQFFVIDGGWSL